MAEVSRSDFSNIIDHLLRSTVFLYSKEHKFSGTGFFTHADFTGKVYHFLISAKHIFKDREKISLRIVREIGGGKKILAFESSIKLLNKNGDPLWFTNWDLRQEIDVAILPANDLVDEISEFDKKVGVSGRLFFFDLSTFVDNSIIQQENICAGCDILFPGYPLGSVAEISYPILRSGIIATPPGKDFDLLSKTRGKYEPVFLVDAQFFPGSSGSPVFWPVNPIRFNVEENKIQQRPNIKLNSPFLLLGVGTAFFHHPGRVSGAPLGTFYRENSGLGIVYRAQVIKNLIVKYVLEKEEKEKLEEANRKLQSIEEVTEIEPPDIAQE